MNERIRELYEQARLNAKSIDPDIDPKGWMDEYHEKFAELIIEDACRSLNPMLRDMISRGQAVDLIRKHFGVES